MVSLESWNIWAQTCVPTAMWSTQLLILSGPLPLNYLATPTGYWGLTLTLPGAPADRRSWEGQGYSQGPLGGLLAWTLGLHTCGKAQGLLKLDVVELEHSREGTGLTLGFEAQNSGLSLTHHRVPKHSRSDS